LGEEGEKQEVDDPEKINNPKVTRRTSKDSKNYRRQGMLGVKVVCG
jgi:hypothetical protein